MVVHPCPPVRCLAMLGLVCDMVGRVMAVMDVSVAGKGKVPSSASFRESPLDIRVGD